jgi:ABC-type uncharacterized transport system involved in gliding motility auxiliary subunit
MSSKEKRSLGGSALLVLAVLFLALTVLNSIVFRGIRLDLTENKLYTISDGTENILAKIEEPLNLYYFYSDRATENIPYLRTYAKRVRELLQELALKSNGRVRLAELDPLPFSEEEDRASQYGLQAVTLGAGSDPIYFGLAGTNAVDDLEVIPAGPRALPGIRRGQVTLYAGPSGQAGGGTPEHAGDDRRFRPRHPAGPPTVGDLQSDGTTLRVP